MEFNDKNEIHVTTLRLRCKVRRVKSLQLVVSFAWAIISDSNPSPSSISSLLLLSSLRRDNEPWRSWGAVMFVHLTKLTLIQSRWIPEKKSRRERRWTGLTLDGSVVADGSIAKYTVALVRTCIRVRISLCLYLCRWETTDADRVI